MQNVRKNTLGLALAIVLIAGFCTSVQAAVTDVLGKWELQTVTDNGDVLESQLVIQKSGDKLTGKIISQIGELPVSDLKYEAGVLSFAIKVDNNGEQFVIRFKGKPADQKINGTGQYEAGGNAGTFTFTGKHTEGAPSGTNADVLGTWTVESTIPDTGEVTTSTLTIKEAGGKLTGTIITDNGELSPETVTYKDNQLVLGFSFDAQGQAGTATVKGKPAGDVMEGKTTFEAPGFTGELPFKAKRIAKPASRQLNRQVVGEWSITTQTPQGAGQATNIMIKEANGKLVGEMVFTEEQRQAAQGQLDLTIKNVKFDGKTLSYQVEISAQGNTFALNYKGQVSDGKKIEGEASGDFQGQNFSFPFSGEKK